MDSAARYDRQHINDDAESMVSSTPTLIQPPPEEHRRFLRHNGNDGLHNFTDLHDVEEQHEHEMQAPSETSVQRRDGFMRLESNGNLRDISNNGGSKWATLRSIMMGPTSRPWFTWLSATAMIVTMVFALAKHHDISGSMLETQPFNPMIGPSFTILINTGARYTPCMRPLPDYQASTVIDSCLSKNATCTLEQLCGGSGSSNQGYRLLSPIFIHAGLLHIVVCLLAHFQVGATLERDMGFLSFGFLYLVCGIWGFAFSSLMSSAQTASMGCSGALMGLVGFMMVETVKNWKTIRRRTRRLASLSLSIILAFVFGIFPGIDNFAHVGGLATGIIMGFLLMSPAASTSRWITWGIRAAALTVLVVVFVIMLYMFYSAYDPTKICPNCRYFSCIPVSNWCDI
ncbi:rhomboid family-domain-containing protein [Zychaea mexicana]|uniref:rhomboid family-domain-containing protein n=1 Tax=Zychaea mexicana TaxID=64656 RepID=UPI0022FDD0E4|nr:rhomboid family-domain-containing protein [Zychaea mexicana]KAI9497480.1 rhomboid family-domain-containing protein [Zychaea mexicana]